MPRKKNGKWTPVSKRRREWYEYARDHREELQKIYDDQGGKCKLCNVEVPMPAKGYPTNYHKHGNHATFDHIKPLSYGGELGIENLRMLCWVCNYKRGIETQKRMFYPRCSIADYRNKLKYNQAKLLKQMLEQLLDKSNGS